MPKKTDLQIKMDLLKKLFDTGCVTEKQLQGFEMENILLIPSITVQTQEKKGSLIITSVWILLSLSICLQAP